MRSTARRRSPTGEQQVPIDTPGRIKAAWAYIHQPVNAGKYSDEEVRTIKIRIRKAADPDEFVQLMDRDGKKRG